MNLKTLFKIVLVFLLLGSSLQAQARIDDAELALMRAFVENSQPSLLFNGFTAHDAEVAAPSERNPELFSRSRKMLQGEVQLWNNRIRIISSWPEDQAVRAIGDGFMEIVDLGYFYSQFNNRNNSRAEAVRRLVGSDSDGIPNFIRGMAEFEEKFYGTAGEGLKNSHTSMKNIAAVYLKEVLRFIDNRYNRALLDLYNENRYAYLNRIESRYAAPYLDGVAELIDFEQLTRINQPDADPAVVAKEISIYSERIDEVKDLLKPYLKEQKKRGNTPHVERLRQSFELLLEDFERSKEGFTHKYPLEARRARL